MTISQKQKANYFLWNGTHISGRNSFPKRLIKNREAFNANDEKALIEWVKDEYSIGVFEGSKLVDVIKDTAHLPNRADLSAGFRKYILVKREDIGWEKVIANPTQVGTPRNQIIKGQDFYSQNLNEFTRLAIMEAIKEQYMDYVGHLTPIDFYPVKIEMEIHDTIENFYGKKSKSGDRWDVDNMAYPYAKAFPDLLTRLKILRDDDRMYITCPPAAMFCPIDDHEERKLIFIITQDTRDVVANHPYYKQFHAAIGESGETEDTLLSKMEF